MQREKPNYKSSLLRRMLTNEIEFYVWKKKPLKLEHYVYLDIAEILLKSIIADYYFS